MPAPDFIKLTDTSGVIHRLKWSQFQNYRPGASDNTKTELFFDVEGGAFSIVIAASATQIDNFLNLNGVTVVAPS